MYHFYKNCNFLIEYIPEPEPFNDTLRMSYRLISSFEVDL